MGVGLFNPKDNTNATSTRPAHVSMGAAIRRWFTDTGAGTKIHAQDLNAILAQFRGAMDAHGITDLEGDDTILAQLLLATMTPRRNHIRNPSFDLWQAGTSFTSGYIADFWKARTLLAGQTYSRQAGFSGARYCLRSQKDAGSGAGSLFIFWSSLEVGTIYQLAGKKVVVSADVRCGADYSGGGVTVGIQSGTGFDESTAFGVFATGAVNTVAPSQVPTTTPQRMVFPLAALPSNMTEANLRFAWTGSSASSGANDWLEVTNVKVEEGIVATPFVAVPFIETYEAAQRLYQKTFALATDPAQNVGIGTGEARATAVLAGAVTQRFHHIPFPVRMRAAPTVTLFNPAAANANVRDITGAVDCSAPSVSATERGIVLTCTGNAATAVGNSLGVHYVADARSY